MSILKLCGLGLIILLQLNLIALALDPYNAKVRMNYFENRLIVQIDDVRKCPKACKSKWEMLDQLLNKESDNSCKIMYRHVISRELNKLEDYTNGCVMTMLSVFDDRNGIDDARMCFNGYCTMTMGLSKHYECICENRIWIKNDEIITNSSSDWNKL